MKTVKDITNNIRDKENKKYRVVNYEGRTFPMDYEQLIKNYKDLYVVNIDANIVDRKIIYDLHY